MTDKTCSCTTKHFQHPLTHTGTRTRARMRAHTHTHTPIRGEFCDLIANAVQLGLQCPHLDNSLFSGGYSMPHVQLIGKTFWLWQNLCSLSQHLMENWNEFSRNGLPFLSPTTTLTVRYHGTKQYNLLGYRLRFCIRTNST